MTAAAPEPARAIAWFRRCPTGGTTHQRPSLEDTVPNLAQLEGTVVGLVAAARDELDPHLQHVDDPDDREHVARKVVERVLRELGTATYQGDEGWGSEPEQVDSMRLDELADEIEDSLR